MHVSLSSGNELNVIFDRELNQMFIICSHGGTVDLKFQRMFHSKVCYTSTCIHHEFSTYKKFVLNA